LSIDFDVTLGGWLLIVIDWHKKAPFSGEKRA